MRVSRRRLLASVPASLLAALAASCASEATDEDAPVGLRRAGRLWEIPQAAWWRPIGDHPPGTTGRTPPVGSSGAPLSRTKRGVPLGGIGAGSVMFNLCGTFGPWHMDPGGDDSPGARWGSAVGSGFEQRFLSQAAFHVRYSTPGATVVQTLATEDVLPAWTRLGRGQGRYSALFPRAWFEYEGLPLPSALKQVTPFVAGDDRWSSLPAGLFQLAVANPTDQPVSVSCMFTFPNAPYRLPTRYAYTRQGLSSQAVTEGSSVGVRLQADSPDNVPQTRRSEWVIAASGPPGAQLSWSEDWAADGNGADVMGAFSATGRLPKRPLDDRRLGLGGAVAVAMELAPGERKAATFVLAWDFPVVQFPNPLSGTRWWRRYTEFYAGPYRAWRVASDVLAGAAALEAAIDAWWKPIAEGEAYPLWLRAAALNELYYDLFGGVFWENGCITRPKRVGRRSGQHLYFTLEDEVYRDCESFDVRHYEARHLTQLFPAIQRDVLLGWADFIMADPLGRTPHDAGSPVDDPWFVPDQYWATRAGEAPRAVDWLDLPAKFVQQVHAYWHYTGDDTFGAEAYPAAVRTMEHVLSLDQDGDGIPDATGYCTTYDALEMHGAATYVAALVIGALEALSDMAATFAGGDAQRLWRQLAAMARASAESTLWVPEEGYYRLDSAGPHSAALMADALCGQRYAAANGLPDVLDPKRMIAHLLLAFRRNVQAVAGGSLGAVNATAAAPGADLGFQGRSVWPGGSYLTAAIMYQLGRDHGRPDLMRAGLKTAYGVYRTTYADDSTAFWFDTPALWVPGESLRYRAASYQRCRAVWELLAAVRDPYPGGPAGGVPALSA
jgi:non-lysosomal glucosylceramidase